MWMAFSRHLRSYVCVKNGVYPLISLFASWKWWLYNHWTKCSFPQKIQQPIPSSKQRSHRKITIFNSKTIYKWKSSHSYVSFLKDIQFDFQSSGLQTKVVSGFKPSRASITWDEWISHKATALGTGDLFIHWGFILQIGVSIYVCIYIYMYTQFTVSHQGYNQEWSGRRKRSV